MGLQRRHPLRRIEVAERVARRFARNPDEAGKRLVEVEDEEDRRGERQRAKDDRRIDDRVARGGEPEHPEDDRKPRRHGGEQRPGDGLVDGFDRQAALLKHRGRLRLKEVDKPRVEGIGGFQLADGRVDLDQKIAEGRPFDAVRRV